MLFGLDAIPLTEPRAGVGHYTFELARALAREAQSDAFELLYPSSYELFEPAPTSTADELASLPPNLSFVRVPVGRLGRRWWSAGLPRYARARGLSLFHGTNFEVPLWGAAVRVITIHDLSQLTRPETHEPRRVRRARLRLPLMARRAHACITPTEFVRREVIERLRINASKVFAVPEAARELFRPLDFAETLEARRRLGAGDEFLLAVGTIEPRKNLPVLLGAFEEVVRARPDSQLRLVVAGRTGWLTGELFKRLDASPARERVVLTGYVSDADLRALYASCRVFVYPSMYEGFGLPPLEAMSCGAPVVASDIPALREVAGDGARLVAVGRQGELARAVLELLEDEPARRSLSARGVARAAEFSWMRAARLTLEVYAEALRMRGAIVEPAGRGLTRRGRGAASTDVDG
jgi:glycosyltransferase involved in cell wall biosynthesis